MQPAIDDHTTIEPSAGTGEDPLALNTAYEQQLKEAATAIGEHAETDQDLEAFLNTLKTTDRRVQADLLAYGRRYDLHFIAGVVCFVKTAEHLPGYLDNLLGEAGVVLAPNAASAERARISGVIRLAIGTVEPTPNVSTRISRLTKTAVGLVLECERHPIAVHLGNIAQVIDTALEHSRSYFQKLVDAPGAAKPDDAGQPTGASQAAPNVPQTWSAASDTVEATKIGTIPAANEADAGLVGNADAEKPSPMTSNVLPTPAVSQSARQAFIGTVPNKGTLEDGVVVLIGRVKGENITVHGPIATASADDLLRSLEDAALSAA